MGGKIPLLMVEMMLTGVEEPETAHLHFPRRLPTPHRRDDNEDIITCDYHQGIPASQHSEVGCKR